jgi:hypothetical protein
MCKLLMWLAAVLVIAPGSARAQATIDLSQVTCADYLAMTPGQSRIFSAWGSGWFNHRFGYVTVGLDDYAKNVASIQQWCTGNPRVTVMSALERTIIQPGPPRGQIKVDMSLITCRQYLSSDAERQEMIAYWMSGYFRASRNQPVFDFTRFANNRRAVGAYCKKRGDETLMSAIQKSAR